LAATDIFMSRKLPKYAAFYLDTSNWRVDQDRAVLVLVRSHLQFYLYLIYTYALTYFS
jgi:hypothetical protein